MPLVKTGRAIVGYLTAPINDKRILEQCPNIVQNQVWHPSLLIALPVTVGALRFAGTETAPPADQDFHSSHPFQALAVVSPGV